jgi:hypothetical protein
MLISNLLKTFLKNVTEICTFSAFTHFRLVLFQWFEISMKFCVGNCV